MKGGFRFRNVEEEEVLRIAMVAAMDGVMIEGAAIPPSAGKRQKAIRGEDDESERERGRDSGSIEKEKDYQESELIEEVK